VRQTNEHLKHYYCTANRLYFRNRLPNDLPVRFAKLRGLGRTKVQSDKVPLWIEIGEDLRRIPCITVMTVLHEMVHVENPAWKGHGWKFERRMLKLAKDGAFAGLW